MKNNTKETFNKKRNEILGKENNGPVHVTIEEPEDKAIKFDMTAVQSFKRSIVVPGDIVKTRGVFPETTTPSDYRICKEKRPALVVWTDGILMTLVPLSSSPGVPGTVTSHRKVAIPSCMDMLKVNKEAVSYLDFAQVTTANVTSMTEVTHTLTPKALEKILKEYFKMIAPSLKVISPKDDDYKDEIINRMQMRINNVYKEKEELHQEYEETLEKVALLEEQLQDKESKEEEYDKLYERAKDLSKENDILLGKLQKGESEYEKLKKILQEKEEAIIKLNTIIVPLSKEKDKVPPNLQAINNKALSDLRVKNKSLNEKYQALEKKYRELEKANEALNETIKKCERTRRWTKETVEAMAKWIQENNPSFDDIIYKIRGGYEKKGDVKYYRKTFKGLNEKFEMYNIKCHINTELLNVRTRTIVKWNKDDLVKIAEEYDNDNDNFLRYYYSGNVPNLSRKNIARIKRKFIEKFDEYGIKSPFEKRPPYPEWTEERLKEVMKAYEESGHDKRTLLTICGCLSEEEIEQKLNDTRYIQNVLGNLNNKCKKYSLPKFTYKA